MEKNRLVYKVIFSVDTAEKIAQLRQLKGLFSFLQGRSPADPAGKYFERKHALIIEHLLQPAVIDELLLSCAVKTYPDIHDKVSINFLQEKFNQHLTEQKIDTIDFSETE